MDRAPALAVDRASTGFLRPARGVGLGLAVIVVCGLSAPVARAQASFTSDGLFISINSAGRVSALIDTVSGRNRVTPLPQYQPYFCSVSVGGTSHTPTTMTA